MSNCARDHHWTYQIPLHKGPVVWPEGLVYRGLKGQHSPLQEQGRELHCSSNFLFKL